MKCPSCQGDKEVFILCTWSVAPCPLCKGSGKVSDHYPQWLKRGRQLRELRFRRGFTLRLEAERRKISTVVLSEMERGIRYPRFKAKKK